ncbi:hypothetical protein ACFX2I_013734 [Malus domestica]
MDDRKYERRSRLGPPTHPDATRNCTRGIGRLDNQPTQKTLVTLALRYLCCFTSTHVSPGRRASGLLRRTKRSWRSIDPSRALPSV